MPFETVGMPNQRGGAFGLGTPDNVTISATTTDNKTGRFALSIRIGGNVLARLGWAPRRDRVLLMEGTGREAGLVKVILASANQRPSYALSSNGDDEKTGNIKVSASAFRHHEVPQAAHPQVAVEFQAFGGEMLLMFPQWVAHRKVRANQEIEA
jgi:hypothetical protein